MLFFYLAITYYSVLFFHTKAQLVFEENLAQSLFGTLTRKKIYHEGLIGIYGPPRPRYQPRVPPEHP